MSKDTRPPHTAVVRAHADYTSLAHAVLARAFLDATKRNILCSRQDHEDAKQWLTTVSDDLAFWCDCAGVMMDRVVAAARRRIRR